MSDDCPGLCKMNNTQMIQKLSASLLDGMRSTDHFCVQEGRISAMESTLKSIDSSIKDFKEERKGIKEDLKEYNDKITESLEKYNEKIDSKLSDLDKGKNTNANEIIKIKIAGYVLITGILTVASFLTWAWGEIKSLYSMIKHGIAS